MTLIYRPGHPMASENGMIDRSCLQGYETGTAPNVIRDEMDATRHMCDNRMYTSKAKFRETTRAHGCVEVGNETATMLKPRQPVQLDRRKRVDDIKRAIHQLRNR